MIFLLVLAVVLLLLGLFTVKLLWWAALVLAVVWLVGNIRSGRRVLQLRRSFGTPASPARPPG